MTIAIGFLIGSFSFAAGLVIGAGWMYLKCLHIIIDAARDNRRG